MFAAAAPVPLDATDERAERHARILRRLAEIGMNLAEAVDMQRQEDGADASELAMKFARIAKAVRQTLALEARLADENRARRAAAEYRRKAEQDRLACRAKNERAIREAQARDIVERAALREAPDPDSEDYAEVAEWLFDETEAEFDADRAAQEIIPEICRLLGVANGWATREDTPLAETDIGSENESRDAPDAALPHRRPSPQVHQASQSP